MSQSIDSLSLFNQTYIRGLNEGLADYWAWFYLQDSTFIKWSLPEYSAGRELDLPAELKGDLQSPEQIASKVDQAKLTAKNPTEYLSAYIYQVGTPYARFLKTLSADFGQNVSKFEVAKKMFNYMEQLASDKSLAKTDSKISTSWLVEQFEVNKTESECQFVKDYLDRFSLYEAPVCVQQADLSWIVTDAQ